MRAAEWPFLLASLAQRGSLSRTKGTLFIPLALLHAVYPCISLDQLIHQARQLGGSSLIEMPMQGRRAPWQRGWEPAANRSS